MNDKTPASGLHREQFTLEDGKILRYSLSVPRLTAGTSVPLVLALHYGGEVTPYYSMPYLQLLVKPALRELGAYIVAPDCPGNGWTDSVSENAVLEFLQNALDVFPVDRGRVVVTGFSLGGFGAWYLAGRHPELFSAAVPVAGRPTGEFDGSVPVYALHGSNDEVVALGPTEAKIESLRENGATAKLVVLDGLTHYQTGDYARPLSGVVAWLEQIWSNDD